AELDNKSFKKREEKISAENRVATSEKSVTTKSINGGGQTKGGTPGAASNLGKSGVSGGGTPGSTSTTESQQSDYVFPRTVIEWQHKQGSIERLTIAAFIDMAALKSSDPPISVDDVKEAIKKAVGFKAERDEIQLTAVKMPSL